MKSPYQTMVQMRHLFADSLLARAREAQAECPDMRHIPSHHTKCSSAADVPGYRVVTGEGEAKNLTLRRQTDPRSVFLETRALTQDCLGHLDPVGGGAEDGRDPDSPHRR